VKERFINGGLENFEEHQVLELLLFYAYPRSDTNEIAHKILNRFGTLTALLEADPRKVSESCDVSINVAVLIALILPISRKYSDDKRQRGQTIDSVTKAVEYIKGFYTGRVDECSYMTLLDIKQRLINSVLISKGDFSEVSFDPRLIVSEAIHARACSVILSHNHPSGDPRPSSADREATKSALGVLKPLEIDLLDHIIIAGEDFYSFNKDGKLNAVY